MNYQAYSEMCRARGITNPYKTEQEFNRAYGVSDYKEPLVITPRNQKRPMKATMSNHDKEPKPKKPKAVKEPRKIMSPEEARLRPERERQRMYSAAKREEMGKPKKRRLSDEEKRAYKREYMKKWRALHPRASYEATMKWRRENPEENRKRRREEKARARERKRTQLKGNNGTE